MGKRRITLDIEEGVLAAVDQVADDRRESRNRFITDAIMRLLQENERCRIDAEFERMAEDTDYLNLLRQMEAESRPSSDEVWRRLEPAEFQKGSTDAAG